MIIVLSGALIIGLTLGLLGSGGSAITVPVLVYLVGHATRQSIAESMAIVGPISIAAAVPYAKARQIDWRSVWYFGLPGMLGTYIGAWLGGLATGAIQLVVFGGVLLVAAWVMLRKPRPGAASDDEQPQRSEDRAAIWKIALEGTLVGIITGFVGVGGGFLIVPALVVFGRLPMRLAIGTSLVIIALKAAIGFLKYQQLLVADDMSVDGQTILVFVLMGVVGGLIGKAVNARMNQRVLRNVFAVFLILLGGFVIVHEGIKLAAPSPQSTSAYRFPVDSELSQPSLAPQSESRTFHVTQILL